MGRPNKLTFDLTGILRTIARRMMQPEHWDFWIDTGGTFTDCLACSPTGQFQRLKVLSSGAVRGRVQEIVRSNQIRLTGLPEVGDEFFTGFEMQRACGGERVRVAHWDAANRCATLTGESAWGFQAGDVVDLFGDDEAPGLAIRVLTGTRLGERFPAASLRLASTRGTNALLEGKCAQTAFFVTAGFADLLRIGDQRRLHLFALNPSKPPALHGPVVEVNERLAADGSVLRPVNLEALRHPATELLRSGVEVAAVALLHSYRNPEHERAVSVFLRGLGFKSVSLSSELASRIRIVPRAATAVVDAMLSPIMERYLDGVGKAVEADRFHVMTSAGGLVKRAAYRPKDSLLSGPAGGVAGAAAVAGQAGIQRIIGFDMGGTSTDVARFEGDFDYRFEHHVGPARVFAPAIRMETVAAGGGSICQFDGAALIVGPESAGAQPGPACYGAGGPLTLTDVNLLLGRLTPDKFGVPVFLEAAEARLAEVIEAVASATGRRPERGQLLQGFLDIADERMADAIRRISVREGFDPADYTMVAFGGAGGLHACAVAGRLGIWRILFPADSGLLSAYGLKQAVSERFAERQIMRLLEVEQDGVDRLLRELEIEARSRLLADGADTQHVKLRRAELELRFSGQESTLSVKASPLQSVRERFLEAYAARYGYVPSERQIEIAVARVVVSEQSASKPAEVFEARMAQVSGGGDNDNVVAREILLNGSRISGPKVVQDHFSTLYVAQDWGGVVGSAGSILLESQAKRALPGSRQAEVVELELFTCRFLSLVEEMGVLLERCALSVNVKDRRDFSCALLDASGELVANAPHIPVHLGALGMCVREVAKCMELSPGDVIVTNHPAYGGSHLPDVTLIAPVHDEQGQLVGYVANRAHHAEIGGIRPGSMPPNARSLAEEGVVISPVHLIRGREADWGRVRQLLAGGEHPSRAVDENLADLHAQLASIRRGAQLLGKLCGQFGVKRVQYYMAMLKTRSAEALAEAISALPAESFEAEDSLDDGSAISVKCVRREGKLVVDFSGSAPVHPGNLNATPAIVHSAVIYVLRLLAGRDLPLNEGLLRDVEIVIPSGLLSPEFPADSGKCPAVVGGNVETSQRVVDVLLQALGLAACSQGTMNNVTFGNKRFSYYETVGGGAGATANADGCDAVHVHMTNTAITDPEIMESRIPVRLEQFAIRHGSGGQGHRRGGNGMVRRITFLEPVELSLLTQRRLIAPPGANGGQGGVPGGQWILRQNGHREDIESAAAVKVLEGDQLVLETPGGGGWGKP